MARPALAIGGIAMIGLGVAIALGWSWESETEATGTVAVPIQTVRLDNQSGTVHVRAADVRETTVRQKFTTRFTDKPGDAYRVGGNELLLGDCGWNCSVDYEVMVPRGTTVTGSAKSGDLTLEGVASTDVHTKSGAIVVRDVDGPMRASTNSGDIRGERLRGTADAEVHSGRIELRLDNAQQVRAESKSGDVEISVPPGAYRVAGSTKSGNRDIQTPTDPAAKATLDLSTQSGDVTVRQH